LIQKEHVSSLETIEAFYAVRYAYKIERLGNFVDNIRNKNSQELARVFLDL